MLTAGLGLRLVPEPRNDRCRSMRQRALTSKVSPTSEFSMQRYAVRRTICLANSERGVVSALKHDRSGIWICAGRGHRLRFHNRPISEDTCKQDRLLPRDLRLGRAEASRFGLREVSFPAQVD